MYRICKGVCEEREGIVLGIYLHFFIFKLGDGENGWVKGDKTLMPLLRKGGREERRRKWREEGRGIRSKGTNAALLIQSHPSLDEQLSSHPDNSQAKLDQKKKLPVI